MKVINRETKIGQGRAILHMILQEGQALIIITDG